MKVLGRYEIEMYNGSIFFSNKEYCLVKLEGFENFINLANYSRRSRSTEEKRDLAVQAIAAFVDALMKEESD